MKRVTHTLILTMGETTCAAPAGEFCMFMGAKSFGTRPHCMLFDAPLLDKGGWVQRSKECKDRFKAEGGVVDEV